MIAIPLLCVRVCVDVELEVLPVAPPPKPRELTEGEVDKIEKQREAVLRELRVFLRDATNKLLAERKFKEFAKPVDPEEVEVACTHTHHTHAHIHTVRDTIGVHTWYNIILLRS